MLFFGDTQESLSRDRIASDWPEWSWADALAAARPGARYRIVDIVFSLVRERCEELDLKKGDEVRCMQNQHRLVELQRLDGRRVFLERDYAWFVQVEKSGDVGGDALSTS